MFEFISNSTLFTLMNLTSRIRFSNGSQANKLIRSACYLSLLLFTNNSQQQPFRGETKLLITEETYIDRFYECSRKFHFQYILKIKLKDKQASV